MAYKIHFEKHVVEEDLDELNNDVRQRILTAIGSRLTISPEQYGVPLRKTLKQYWKLRVGDYRVVFKLVKSEVHIIAIVHRKKVYLIALNRIN